MRTPDVDVEQPEEDLLPAILVAKRMRELCGGYVRDATLENCTRLLNAASSDKDRNVVLEVLCHARPEIAWDLRQHVAAPLTQRPTAAGQGWEALPPGTAKAEAPRWGGPDRCLTGPCADCGPFPDAVTDRGSFIASHHFSTELLGDPDEGEDEEPTRLGHQHWHQCKHCPAWIVDLDEEGDESASSGAAGSDLLDDADAPLEDAAGEETSGPVEAGSPEPRALVLVVPGFSGPLADGEVEQTPESRAVADLKRGAHLLRVPLDKIITVEQPRKFFDEAKLKALAASIKQNGLINPPLLRPQGDDFIIVAGDRRCRAARMAGLIEIEARVREMTLEEASDAQAAENLQREALLPLEEAWHYHRQTLPVDEGGLGRTVQEIAAKTGVSEAHVYSLRNLIHLCPEGNRALELGQVVSTVAQQVARIPDPARQAKCVQDLVRMRPAAEREEDREPLSSRQALAHIRANYMLDLANPPFRTDDDLLVPEAGPCTKCPHNSLNQPGDLFQTRAKAQCLKADCYEGKVSALWATHQDAARAKGHKAVSLKQGRALYGAGTLAYDAPYVELGAPCPDDKKKRTWRELLGASCPPVTVAPDAKARPHELVDRAQALAALAEEGHGFAKRAKERAAPVSNTTTRPIPAVDDAEEQLRERSRRAFVEDAVRVAEQEQLSQAALRLIAETLMAESPWAEFAERRGLSGGLEGCMALVDKASEPKLRGIITELSVLDYFTSVDGDDLRPLAKKLGLSIKEIEARVRQTMEAEAATAGNAEKRALKSKKRKTTE